MKRGRPLTPEELRRLKELREKLKLFETFNYKASAREVRRKIDALCKGRDLETDR